jgi:DNA end-binding protein Ku
MKAVWSGALAFGLVSIPVKLYGATEEHRVPLREVHAADGGRVRHKRWCTAEDREIEYADVGRAWEAPGGRLVQLTESELAALPLPSRRAIEVVGFVPDEIDPISYSRAYYIGPDGQVGNRPYTLLLEALGRSGLSGLARVAVRSRERLAVIRPRHGVLVLHTLLWSDEVREPDPGMAPDVPVTDRELELAEVLIRELVGVEPREVHDEYATALRALVEAKLAGESLEELAAPEPVVDLMAALEASVRQARERRDA